MNEMRDTAVQKTASLHEKAVQAVASGEVAPMPKRRGKGREKPVVHPLHTDIKVHPQVWVAALGLLEGSYTRIDIVDETTVVVR